MGLAVKWCRLAKVVSPFDWPTSAHYELSSHTSVIYHCLRAIFLCCQIKPKEDFSPYEASQISSDVINQCGNTGSYLWSVEIFGPSSSVKRLSKFFI